MYCKNCGKNYSTLCKHNCDEVHVFAKWLDKNLEAAIEAFRNSPVFQFELYYQTWRSNTPK
jgi:transcription elongation factor Elf1